MLKSSKGFTLLEVMVALAIVAITLVAIGGLRNRDIVYHAELRQMIKATLLAQERMTVVEIAEDFPGAGERSGQFEGPYKEFSWTQSVVPTPFAFAWEIQIQVRWGKRSHEVVRLVSYILEEEEDS